MAHIALFGTSADPPTYGHQAILEWLATQFDWVVVWAADNPFKQQQTPLQHRQAMLELLIEHLGRSVPNVRLCPSLSDARTLNSVQKAQQKWPQDGLTLVVGSDVVGSLPHWYQVQELLTLIEILIVPRPGTPVTEANLKAVRELGGRLQMATFMGPNVSSTEYRQSPDRETTLPAIADYIRHHALYGPFRG
ncbi:MAG: nicotinate-nucleotide adenylyltransferase [Thermosynechococcaceae cyanobacterium]